MKVLRRIPLALALTTIVCTSLATQGRRGEQTSFAEDQPLHSPVQISPDVLKVLLETKEAEQGLDLANDSKQDHPTQLFRAAEVHLSRPDEVDLVVIGVCPMCGADNGWFWLVRSARSDPKVVLFAGGNILELMNSRTNGCRDIRSAWSSSSETKNTLYHFDGKEYKVWQEKWTKNRN